MTVRFVTITPNAEEILVYCARVSNPDNQENMATGPQLIRGMINRREWSPFQMVNMLLEITTTRAVSAQIIRHRSMPVQEFSQRWAHVEAIKPRAGEGRQISDPATDQQHEFFTTALEQVARYCLGWYRTAVEMGIAYESARFLLPMATTTRLYINGYARSWIHYIQARADPEAHVQDEHFRIALEVKDIFCEQFPLTAEALGWRGGEIMEPQGDEAVVQQPNTGGGAQTEGAPAEQPQEPGNEGEPQPLHGEGEPTEAERSSEDLVE